ncbi:NAD(P)-dependent oxidoreductase [Actinotalea sp. K2]|uniref:NAD(P)-dependent oxidoreductase n=1 Tax=Actinotalea sp. K2 TaxID=2939438 RepID=UPI002017D0D2|nr:NAD(P)-dependent oxidoreductase [Actinotalea sp. K2]MCL3860494.1 dihydrofolate reductase [Actinotalea sp. K2]
MLTVTLAHPELIDAVVRDGWGPASVRVVQWDLRSALPCGTDPAEVDVVVVPNYLVDATGLRALHGLPSLRVVQLPSAGFEHALAHLPAGVTLCNGRGVHDAGTAELAVGLVLASQRGIDDAVRAMPEGRWSPVLRRSLADRRVMVLGHGSIGSAIGRRLAAFEVDVVRVARTARTSPDGPVHAVDDLPGLLPTVDVVVVVVPLTPQTTHLVDARFLAALPDGALLVNVARGKVVDTAALLVELGSGRLRAALDVTDPEPLPPEHPLWRAPHLVLTPHVGGLTDATTPRLAALVRRQVEALVAGDEPLNVVART